MRYGLFILSVMSSTEFCAMHVDQIEKIERIILDFNRACDLKNEKKAKKLFVELDETIDAGAAMHQLVPITRLYIQYKNDTLECLVRRAALNGFFIKEIER